MQWIHTVIVAHSLTLALVTILFIGVLRKSPKSIIHWTFLALLTGNITWLICNGTSEFLTIKGINSDFIGSIAGLTIQWMVICIFILCEYLPAGRGSKHARTRIIALALVSASLCPMVFSDQWIANRRIVGEATEFDPGVWYTILSMWGLFVILFGLSLLFAKYRRESDARLKLHMGVFLMGVLLSSAIAFVFSYILPVLGAHTFFFLGVDSVIVFLALITYGILFHRMLDLRTMVLRISFRFALSFALSFAIYSVFLVTILNRNISDFSWDLAFVLSLFFLAAVVFARRILPALDRALFFPRKKTEDLIIELLGRISDESAMNDTLQEILDALARGFPFKKGIILAADFEKSFWLHYYNCELTEKPAAKLLFRRLLAINRLPEDFFTELNKTFLLEDFLPFPAQDSRIDSDRYRRTLETMNTAMLDFAKDDFQVFMPLMYERKACGIIILGGKKDDSPYYAQDLMFLDALRLAIAILLQFKRNLNRMSLLRHEAQSDLAKLTDLIGARSIKKQTVQNKTIVYQSPAMHEIMAMVEKIADNPQPVLVTGETGTGKELIARLIHKHSRRSKEPFVAVNCAAISDSLWEDELFGHVKGAFTDAKTDRPGRVLEAADGVLFLDEIGEMPLEMQAKLLRLLQERKYSPVGSDRETTALCRFIFATNRTPGKMIAEGNFREDLFYRINVFNLHLPPLRERTQDIPVLLDYYLKKSAEELGFALKNIEPGALGTLLRYPWPGNIRELENFVIRTAALSESDLIGPADLPLAIKNAPRPRPSVFVTRHDIPASDVTLREMVDDYTKRIITETLKKSGGNRTRAAEMLGVKRGSLLYRMKELNIK